MHFNDFQKKRRIEKFLPPRKHIPLAYIEYNIIVNGQRKKQRGIGRVSFSRFRKRASAKAEQTPVNHSQIFHSF